MILYRKGAPLRIRRLQAPEPPFFCATQLAPYGPRRSSPVGIDFLTMRAVAGERLEVPVAGDVRDTLERSRNAEGPALIDAAGPAERIFRRGEDVLRFLDESSICAVHLVSARGALPSFPTPATIVIAAWPLDLRRLEALAAEAAGRSLRWGLLVPLVFPLTTELAPLDALVSMAVTHQAAFLAAASIEADPVARQAVARTLDLEPQDDRYATLFHGSVEPIQLSTERHLAALAAERGLADHVVLPDHDARTNWTAAALLTATATRMFAMELDLELATSIARSARLVAALDKPLTRISESASLSIIGGLDETSAEMLDEWLERGSAAFAEFVDEQWRLPRA